MSRAFYACLAKPVMPDRGFETAEFEGRVLRAQAAMRSAGLDAMFFTTEPEIRYFTGYLTRFWESPSRPWFLVLPQSGKPVAVIPSIGAALMSKTWITDIRTWSSPDLEDDGLSLLASTIKDRVSKAGRIAVPSGHETHLRMPLSDFERLKAALPLCEFTSDHGIMRSLRMVKSEAEIAKIKTACEIAGRAFDRVPEIAQQGRPLDAVFRGFQSLCLQEGADWVPYLAGGHGPLGYEDVISPAGPELLQPGDALMLDTGLVHDGYFCDFDRNFVAGKPAPELSAAWERLLEAVEAGKEAAMPGKTAADVFHAMDKIVTGGKGTGDAGRLGHGLGMQLTEWPSLIASDQTVLQAGMVLTLEPGTALPGGGLLVHEDDFVIREAGPEQLSPLASLSLPRLD